MPRMVRITATNTSKFYSCIPSGTNATHRVVRFLLTFSHPGHKNKVHALVFGLTVLSVVEHYFRLDTRRNSTTAQRIWVRQSDNLAAVASWFAGVLIGNRSAIQCMRDHATVSTLHVVDPLYVHDTRVETAKYRANRFEMTDAEYAELLNALKDFRGAVIVYGYNSDLYNSALTCAVYVEMDELYFCFVI